MENHGRCSVRWMLDKCQRTTDGLPLRRTWPDRRLLEDRRTWIQLGEKKPPSKAPEAGLSDARSHACVSLVASRLLSRVGERTK